MMNKEISGTSKEVAYSNIRTSIINAQSTICRVVNSAIVQMSQIFEICVNFM